MEMTEELRKEIERLKWRSGRYTWGLRIDGDMHGATILRPDGVKKYYRGPFWTAHGGGQIAIRYD